jgi:hypothetical protein
VLSAHVVSFSNFEMKHSKVEGAYCLGVFQNGKDPTTLLGGKALNFSRSFKKFAFQSFYICYICHLHCMIYHSLCCWPSWTSILLHLLYMSFALYGLPFTLLLALLDKYPCMIPVVSFLCTSADLYCSHIANLLL